MTRNRNHIPRWQRVALVAASVLLSTGVATTGAALGASPEAATPSVEAEETTTIAPAEDGTVIDPTVVVDPAPMAPSAEEVAGAPDQPPVVDEGTEEGPAEGPVEVPTEDPAAEPIAPAPAEDPAPAAAPAVPLDEHEQDGPTITVNGQPFKGEADPKLEGCTITLAIADLEDGAHEVSGSIVAEEPSGEGALVAFGDAFEGTTWTDAWPLDDLVGDLVQKPNGYRIRVLLTIDDGGQQASRLFWIACGAAQEGNPYSIVLDKQWQAADGTVLAGPPADLPEDWAITASSQLGSATCTYPEGSDELVCEYDNKGGHEGETDGLKVPGGKDKTYTVSESPLPDGWTNVAGIGTFAPREVCPGGHDDGGHDDGLEDAVAAVDEGQGGREPCPHVVVNRALPVEPTTTVPETTVPTETTAPGSDVEGSGADRTPAAEAGALARTGDDSRPMAVLGMALVLGGVLLLGARRRTLRSLPQG